MKQSLIYFIFSVVFMGAFTYFYFNPPAIYYLFLLPYGIIIYSIHMNKLKKWRENVYKEIDNINDSALKKAIPMNYMYNIIAENGIGFIYSYKFIFKFSKNDIQLVIPFSDISKVEPSTVLYFFTGINMQLKDGSIKRFIIEKKQQIEVSECINSLLQQS